MTTLRIRVDAREDGASLKGFPLESSLDVSDVHALSFPQIVGDTYQNFPTEEVDPITVVALEVLDDAEVVFRLNGQTDRGIKLERGCFIVFGTSLAMATVATDPELEASQVKVKNNETTPTELRVVLAGA